MSERNESFLALLLKKKSDVLLIGDQTGKNTASAVREVERQIGQVVRHDPISGFGVTKSGKEN